MSIELWILLWAVCGVAVWATCIWAQDFLEVKDLFILPILLVIWPAFLVIGFAAWMASGPTTILWRRKK